MKNFFWGILAFSGFLLTPFYPIIYIVAHSSGYSNWKDIKSGDRTYTVTVNHQTQYVSAQGIGKDWLLGDDVVYQMRTSNGVVQREAIVGHLGMGTPVVLWVDASPDECRLYWQALKEV